MILSMLQSLKILLNAKMFMKLFQMYAKKLIWIF